MSLWHHLTFHVLFMWQIGITWLGTTLTPPGLWRLNNDKFIQVVFSKNWSVRRDQYESKEHIYENEKNILTRKNLDLSLWVRLVWSYIAPVLFHGMENWVLSLELQKCIEVLEVFINRHLIMINCRDKVTDEVSRPVSNKHD